jgi:hypothetical protein
MILKAGLQKKNKETRPMVVIADVGGMSVVV